MVFLLRSFSTNRDLPFGGYAIVELGADELRRLGARRKALLAAKADDNQLYEMWYWSGGADFYGDDTEIHVADTGADSMHDLLDDEEIRVLTADEAASMDSLVPDRTDANQLIVREDGVSWYACDKYGDTTTTTAEIPWAVLS